MNVARATHSWLTLREAADARARSTELLATLCGLLPENRPLKIHDLGCGTGSTRRWLGPQLSGLQEWTEYDRDCELLHRGVMDSTKSIDGIDMSVHTRCSDFAELTELDLHGADLITASALLDMFSASELLNFVSLCVSAGCPCLITLSVVGHVEFSPPDSLDARIEKAFNDHQRRPMPSGRLLGPEAVSAAAELFEQAGMSVLLLPSIWQLGPTDGSLLEEWISGWLGAALEQDATLRNVSTPYMTKRNLQLKDGLLNVEVHHQDLLAWHL